ASSGNSTASRARRSTACSPTSKRSWRFAVSDLAARIAALPESKRIALAQRLAARTGGLQNTPVEAVPRQTGDLPLYDAPERLWFPDQLAPGNPAYNLSFAHRIGAAVDAAALEHALTALVARHEGLRTTFPVVDEVPVQRLAEATRVSCPVVDLRPLAPRRR